MTPEQQVALRASFPASQVGLLPRPKSKDAQKGSCRECGGWHGLPAIHLDYVGHGAVTDRLLAVDPSWSWEPMALDADGLPLVDRQGNLWIRLTVCGVTRLGVGDGSSLKEKIGDAIRNAAMRFGVALDLWIKGQEDEKSDDDPPRSEQPQHTPAAKDRLDALVARIKGLTEAQSVEFDEWKSGHRFAWPWSEPACVVIETQVDRIVGGGGDAEPHPGDGQAMSLDASPGPSAEQGDTPLAGAATPDGPTLEELELLGEEVF